nr:lipocalin family protein [Pseudogemmobacter hezensis]
MVLAACSAQKPADQTRSFRSPGADIWSAAAFSPAGIAGGWHQVAGFSEGGGQGCRAGAAEFTQNGAAGLNIRARLCLNGREVSVSGPVTPVGPGRLSVPGMGDWWVIWVDSGYRTLAIATPDGSFGFVLDRGQIPRDRLRAAAEIFDFNGYRRDMLLPF